MEVESSLKNHSGAQHNLDLHFYFSVIIIIDVVALNIGVKSARGVGSFLGYSGSTLLVLFPSFLTLVFSILGLIGLHGRYLSGVTGWAREIFHKITSKKILGIILFALLNLFLGYYYLSGMTLPLLKYLPVFWVLGALAVMGGVLLSGNGKFNPSIALLVSFAFYSLALVIFYYLPEITAYPLSLDWSEGSRFYDASLFFSQQIYGKRIPTPSLDPTRAFLQSLPFLVPSLPIWVHRLWRVCLWLGIPLLCGWVLANRLQKKNIWLQFGLSVWFLVYAFQGPVYFHLLVVVLIILFGFNKNRLGRSLFFVALASLWAGASRVNWFPVPGMLAAVLYILEIPQKEKKFWAYWYWPITAVIMGLGLAFAAQAGYAVISGQPSEAYITSFKSPLYWYRLLPNEAFGPGVINLMLIASFPLWMILLGRILPHLKCWRTLRLWVLLSCLTALMAAGLIVSTKIGGGSNLHNLDSYLVTLTVITVYVAFNRFIPDFPKGFTGEWYQRIFYAFALLVPFITLFNQLQPMPVRDTARAWQNINKLQKLIDETSPEDGEILMIQDRQLLTFGAIENVELVPEYEKVFLMEMAMSNNEAYMDRFHTDLENHRFSLIVMEPIQIYILSPDHYFGEENNVWIDQVVFPMLAAYDVTLDLSESGMVVLAPKAE